VSRFLNTTKDPRKRVFLFSGYSSRAVLSGFFAVSSVKIGSKRNGVRFNRYRSQFGILLLGGRYEIYFYISFFIFTANPVRQSIYRQINCTSITSIPTPVRRAEVDPGVKTWTDTAAKAGEKYCYFVTVSAKTSKTSTTTIESGPSIAILVTAN